MKSITRKENNTYVNVITFGNNDEFTYTSRFKSDLKGVAHQQLRTEAVDKETLDVIKNMGAKNICSELAKLGFEFDPSEILGLRKESLEKARQDDIEPESIVDKLAYKKNQIDELKETLKRLEEEYEVFKAESRNQLEEELNKLEEYKKVLKKELK